MKPHVGMGFKAAAANAAAHGARNPNAAIAAGARNASAAAKRRNPNLLKVRGARRRKIAENRAKGH